MKFILKWLDFGCLQRTKSKKTQVKCVIFYIKAVL